MSHYVPSPAVSTSWNNVPKRNQKENKYHKDYRIGLQPKILRVPPKPEILITEKERIELFFRRKYLVKLSGGSKFTNYSQQEIANRLER